MTFEALGQLAEAVQGRALDAVLRWAAAGCAVRSLAAEIQDASMRISGLVTAIKGFTHMDQAMVAEPVDLGPSLGNTVAVLKVEGAREIGGCDCGTGGRPAAGAWFCWRVESDMGQPDRQRTGCGT